MSRGKWIIFGILFFLATSVSAEIYKYVDKNGNVLYTDDLSMVPKEQRAGMGVFEETTDNTAPEDVKPQQQETEAGTPDKAQGAWERLESRKAELDKEYEALMQERASLNKEKEKFLSSRRFKSGTDSIVKREYKELNAKLEALKKKFEDLEKKKAAYQADLKAAETPPQ